MSDRTYVKFNIVCHRLLTYDEQLYTIYFKGIAYLYIPIFTEPRRLLIDCSDV
jgi:hypothetical protein